MRYKKQILALLLLLVVISIIGCGGKSGESYINLPEGPKILFRGGIGKITIRYVPPPDPIFRISNAMEYIEFPFIKENYGIPDKPLIIDYTRFGKGPMRISVDVAKKRISVDASNIRLAEQEPGRPAPKMGNVRELVKQIGFTVVTGSLY